MEGITIGKFIPGKSFAHSMDPRFKLLITIALVVLVFFNDNYVFLACVALPVILLHFLSPLEKIQLVKIIIPVGLIGVFLFIINLFVIRGEATEIHHYFAPISAWKITVSEQAVFRTTILMIRVYVMIAATTVLIATTSPPALTRAIEDLIYPLKLIRIPTNIIAMIISVALRFIPTLLSEAQRIVKAQASRGVDFKNGNIKTKMKSLITLIIPLFVSAFSKAEDLGNAMEVRGYDPYAKRIRYRAFYPSWRDLIAVIIMGGLIATTVLFSMGIAWLPSIHLN